MSGEERSFLSISAFVFGIVAVVFGFTAVFLSKDDASSTGADSPAAASATPVAITLSEFAMTPAMPTVPPGDLAVTVTNNGTMVHNFEVPNRNVTTGDIEPGESKTVTIKNVTEGDLEFICTIPSHADQGMKGMFMVQAGASSSGSGTDGSATSDTATSTTMDWVAMDKAMEKVALDFVNEPKSAFGGTPLEPKVLADGTKEFDLTAKVVDWEVQPGKIVKAWTYNGMVPGPELRADVGDKIRIVLKNELPESTVIHFHGVRVPNAMDGVDPYTQDPVEPGQTFTYEFTALEPAVGMYHSHHDAQVQVPNGMAGALLIGEMPIPDVLKEQGYTDVDKEVNMVLNDSGTLGLTLNGKSFPATEPYSMKVGQVMKVNYFNEGVMAHPMHMHQPTGWIIAKDGVPLLEPTPADTINVAPGERYTVLYKFVDPGVWAWHCHILTHAEGPDGMFGMVTAVIVDDE